GAEDDLLRRVVRVRGEVVVGADHLVDVDQVTGLGRGSGTRIHAVDTARNWPWSPPGTGRGHRQEPAVVTARNRPRATGRPRVVGWLHVPAHAARGPRGPPERARPRVSRPGRVDPPRRARAGRVGRGPRTWRRAHPAG